MTYIGHFNHVKGVELLIRAFGDVLQRHPDVRFVIAWSGIGSPKPIYWAIEATGIESAVIWYDLGGCWTSLTDLRYALSAVPV